MLRWLDFSISNTIAAWTMINPAQHYVKSKFHFHLWDRHIRVSQFRGDSRSGCVVICRNETCQVREWVMWVSCQVPPRVPLMCRVSRDMITFSRMCLPCLQHRWGHQGIGGDIVLSCTHNIALHAPLRDTSSLSVQNQNKLKNFIVNNSMCYTYVI